MELVEHDIDPPPPTNLIISVSTRIMSISVAPLAHIDWGLTYSRVNPTYGLVIFTAARIALVISVFYTNVHLFCGRILTGMCGRWRRVVEDMSQGAGWIPPHIPWGILWCRG